MPIQVKSKGRVEFPVLIGRGHVELRHPLGVAVEKRFENASMIEVEGIVPRYTSELFVNGGVSGSEIPMPGEPEKLLITQEIYCTVTGFTKVDLSKPNLRITYPSEQLINLSKPFRTVVGVE